MIGPCRRPQALPFVEAAWDFASIRSTIAEEQLAAWRQQFNFPMGVRMFMPYPEERPHLAPLGCTVVYYRSLMVGLRFPLPLVLTRFLRRWGLPVAQVHPNAWARLIGLFILFNQQGWPEPSFEEFNSLFLWRSVRRAVKERSRSLEPQSMKLAFTPTPCRELSLGISPMPQGLLKPVMSRLSPRAANSLSFSPINKAMDEMRASMLMGNMLVFILPPRLGGGEPDGDGGEGGGGPGDGSSCGGSAGEPDGNTYIYVDKMTIVAGNLMVNQV
ncbi:hypothetical protein OROHE_005811 [Orobanche hederae]